MGRRHLVRLAAVGVALAFAGAAGGGLQWRLLAHGIARGQEPSEPAAYIALNLAATTGFTALLPPDGTGALARNDFAKNAVVAVFGEFGCTDHRVVVASVFQNARRIVVSLVLRRPTPGTVECMAIYPTYRLLAISKAQLVRPYPTSAEASLARA